MTEYGDCPTCGGVGVIDTSPPQAVRAPWLTSDQDCPECDGAGTIPDPVEGP